MKALTTEQLTHMWQAAQDQAVSGRPAPFHFYDAIRAALSAPAAPSEQGNALKFADHIINGMFEGGDWDGGDVQELAVKYGLLTPETMQGPCNEDGACQCAQNGAEFPSTCYRKTYASPQAPVAAVQGKVLVSEGWKLVPIQPTSAMVDAGASADPERESVWAAYLSAAPDA